MDKNETVPGFKTRNPHVQACKKRSKKLPRKGDRRAKDARRSWRAEEH